LTLVDAFDAGLGWIDDGSVPRTSHALAVDGRVWLIDAVEPADDAAHAVAGLGEPAGVIQLLDRHRRDSAALAWRLGVPLHVTPFDGVPGAPFDPVAIVRQRFWREVALWWPEERVLLCGDALGTVGYFVASGELLGVHPLLRLTPPKALARFAPRHVLCGHGEGVHGDEAAPALDEALATARRRFPAAFIPGRRSMQARS
jgi:hypothetical protein